MKARILVILLGVLCLASCAQTLPGNRFGGPASNARRVPATFEPVYASLPSYRIDNQLERISIIGSGPDYEQMQSGLTKLFTERTEIKVVEPANLQSVLAGKVIEYRTGISPSDAQLLSRMFQIDHLLLFDIEMAPYSAYKFGGRDYAVVNLKIVNTVDGEILFQASRNVGALIDDPRKYGYVVNNEQDAPRLRYAAFASLAYELRYAINDVVIGWVLKPGTNVISEVLVGSVADNDGIQKDDAIVRVNGTKVSNESEMNAYIRANRMKQGDEVTFTIERQGKTLEKRVKYPVIPQRPEKEEKEPSREETKKMRLF